MTIIKFVARHYANTPLQDTRLKLLYDDKEKALKSYGLLMGGMLALFMGLFLYQGHTVASTLAGALASIFATLALAAPLKLEWVHGKWMKFAEVMGNFNAKLILGFIYLALFSLVRLVFLLTGKDPMKRKFEPGAATYWEDHPKPGDDPKRFEKPY